MMLGSSIALLVSVTALLSLPSLINGRQSTVHTSDSAQRLEPPTLNNIGYLGSCYNIIKGNPKPTVDFLLDPGILAVVPFEFTYDQQQTTTDGRYSIPDNTDANDIQSCSFTFSSSIIRDLRAYTDSLKTHVDTDFTKWGASFSANRDYQKVQQMISNGENIFVSSEAECQAYGASIGDAEFIQAFIEDVASLPITNSSLETYIEFVQQWGTHIITSITMGGRFGVRSEFSARDYSYLSSSQINIKAAAGYSGFMLINGSLPTEQKKQAQIFDDSRQNYDVYLAGYAPSVNKNGIATEWATIVNESPLPLSYGLIELSQYFTPRYFPQDTNITTKRILLQNATNEYCKRTASDPTLCQKQFSPNNEKTQVNTKNTIINITEHQHTQYSDNPNMRIVGVLVGEGKAGSPSVIMVDSRNAPHELITEAIGYTQNSTEFIRYKCPDNFYTVSDFFNNNSPPALPCIASQCLARCGRSSFHFDQFNVYLIAYGFVELGNSGDPSLLSFFRDPNIPFNGHEEDLYKCLTYECLFIQ